MRLSRCHTDLHRLPVFRTRARHYHPRRWLPHLRKAAVAPLRPAPTRDRAAASPTELYLFHTPARKPTPPRVRTPARAPSRSSPHPRRPSTVARLPPRAANPPPLLPGPRPFASPTQTGRPADLSPTPFADPIDRDHLPARKAEHES